MGPNEQGQILDLPYGLMNRQRVNPMRPNVNRQQQLLQNYRNQQIAHEQAAGMGNSWFGPLVQPQMPAPSWEGGYGAMTPQQWMQQQLRRVGNY